MQVEVLQAFAEKRWSISPAEAWAEVVLLDLGETVAPEANAVTDFTDNESTRAAAKNGRCIPLCRALSLGHSRSPSRSSSQDRHLCETPLMRFRHPLPRVFETLSD